MRLHWDVAFAGLWDTIKEAFTVTPWAFVIIALWIAIAVIWAKDSGKTVIGSMIKLLFILVILAILYSFSSVAFYIIVGLTLAISVYCAFAR